MLGISRAQDELNRYLRLISNLLLCNLYCNYSITAHSNDILITLTQNNTAIYLINITIFHANSPICLGVYELWIVIHSSSRYQN